MRCRTLLHLFPPVFLQVLLFSFCLLLVPAMYSSDARGSLPAEHRGEGLEDATEDGLGRAPATPDQALSPQYCPVSFEPFAARTPRSWSHLPCSQRYQRTAWTVSSRLLATLAASCIPCLRLLEQSLPCNCRCLMVSQSAPAQIPYLPCMQISQERKDGSLLPAPHLSSCRADIQARCEDVGGPPSESGAPQSVFRGKGRGEG